MDKEVEQRYKGHISLPEIGLEGQLAIMKAKVLIVGAGGLGSPVAIYLAAAGVGTIGIVDADVVSLSNLQRQIAHSAADLGTAKTASMSDTLARVNPGVSVVCHQMMLTRDNASRIIADYDVVVDCTDSRDARLTVNDACVANARPYVFGAVSRCSGLAFTYLPGSADYRARFTDESTDEAGAKSCAVTGILNTLPGIIGSIQATEVIKIITGFGQPLTGRILTLDAATLTFNTFHL